MLQNKNTKYDLYIYMCICICIYIYIYISFVRVYVTELLLNGWTDFYEIFCMCSGGFENGLDLQFGII